MMKKSISYFIILIGFVGSVLYASEKEIYTQALNRIDEEHRFLKKTYSDALLSQLDKKNFRNKTYKKRLNLIYSGIESAKNILVNKIKNLSDPKDGRVERIIYIDPGHGGTDPGATIPPIKKSNDVGYLFTESSLTFEISKIVKKKLEALGYCVILSRDEVTDGPSLYARSALCRAIKPDISLSVHLNSTRYAYPIYDDPDTAFSKINYTRAYVWGPSGFDLFYPFYIDRHKKVLSSGSRKESIRLADLIVRSFKTNLGLDYTLSEEDNIKLARVKQLREDLKQSVPKKSETEFPVVKAKYAEDISLDILNENKIISKQYLDDVKDYYGVDSKDLHMVRETPSIPSVLLEAVFLSCPVEQYLFEKENRVEQIANAIVVGIKNYFREDGGI